MAASKRKPTTEQPPTPTTPTTTSTEINGVKYEDDPGQWFEALAVKSANAAMELNDPREAHRLMAYAQVMAQLGTRHETARAADALAGFTTAFDAMGAALEHIDRSLHQRPSS